MAVPPCDVESSQELFVDKEEDSPYPCLNNVGEEIAIKGRVVRITKDYVLERRRRYTCSRCKAIADGESRYEHYYSAVIPKCPNRRKDCTGYMRLATKDPCPGDLMKFQEVMLQEIDSTEAIPRIFTATLEGDLIDQCAPGESVELLGTVALRSSPIGSAKTRISIGVRCTGVRNLDGTRLNPDVEEMVRVAGQKWRALVQAHGDLVARDLLLRCSFPSVKGMCYPKLALLLLLTGSAEGIRTRLATPIRCQSHLLLVGDPGTAKSQLLQWAARYVSPSLYTNAFGCTSAGLTAAAVRTGAHWTLQAGVLVLCDGGLCCIDEWGLLKPVDQASCHEAMEQQTVSIAKAGIATRLSTRCSIVAATNPKKDTGSHAMTTAGLGLSTSLISRFDLILAVRDERDDEWDEQVADFLLARAVVTGGNKDIADTDNAEGEGEEVSLFTELEVRAHLMMARNVRPIFDQATYEVITAYYRHCRDDEFRDWARTTVRLQESLIRLSCAHARLCCRARVTVVDAVTAICLLESSVGFGRLLRPLPLTKEGELPLEPSRERVVQVLRALEVSEDMFNAEEHYNGKGVVDLQAQDMQRGEEEEVIIPAKKRKLNDQGGCAESVKPTGGNNIITDRVAPIIVIEQAGTAATACLATGSETQRVANSSRTVEERAPPVQQMIAEEEDSLAWLITEMQKGDETVDLVNEDDNAENMGTLQVKDSEINAASPRDKPNEDELSVIDQSSRDSQLSKVTKPQTVAFESEDGCGKAGPSDADEEEQVGLSQVSLHSLCHRLQPRIKGSDTARDPNLEEDWEALQNRLNDFDLLDERQEDKEEITEKNFDEFAFAEPPRPGPCHQLEIDLENSQSQMNPSVMPTASVARNLILNENVKEDDHQLSQIVIPSESDTAIAAPIDQNVKESKIRPIEEIIEIPSTSGAVLGIADTANDPMLIDFEPQFELEDGEDWTFASFIAQVDFSCLKTIPKRLFDKERKFTFPLKFKPDADEDDGDEDAAML